MTSRTPRYALRACLLLAAVGLVLFFLPGSVMSPGRRVLTFITLLPAAFLAVIVDSLLKRAAAARRPGGLDPGTRNVHPVAFWLGIALLLLASACCWAFAVAAALEVVPVPL